MIIKMKRIAVVTCERMKFPLPLKYTLLRGLFSIALTNLTNADVGIRSMSLQPFGLGSA